MYFMKEFYLVTLLNFFMYSNFQLVLSIGKFWIKLRCIQCSQTIAIEIKVKRLDRKMRKNNEERERQAQQVFTPLGALGLGGHTTPPNMAKGIWQTGFCPPILCQWCYNFTEEHIGRFFILFKLWSERSAKNHPKSLNFAWAFHILLWQ